MSLELHVFLSDSKVPTRTDWQRAITEAGFDLTLDPTLEPRVDNGFVPIVYKGTETGFELDFWPASDILDAYQDIATRVGERDKSLNFRWGGDLNELASAVIAAGVLVKITGGVLLDPQDGTLVEGDKAIEMVHQQLREIADLK